MGIIVRFKLNSSEQNFQSLEISRLKYLEFACVTNKIAGLNNSDMI